MARRDVRQPGPQAPNTLQGASVGFSTGASRLDPNVPDISSSDFSAMKDVWPAVAKITEGVMGTARENAFRQGQADQAADMLNIGNTVDSAAALIEQASWLTRDSYAQGVKFQEYSEGQLETQSEISAQIAKSVERGESIQEFSQKIKPSLAKLNSKIAAFGLQGKAKDLAIDQMLGYTVAAQKGYQAAMEVKAETIYRNGLNQNTASSLDLLTNTQSIGDVVDVLNNAYDKTSMATSTFDPANAADATAKQLTGLVSEFSTRVIEASPADAMRVTSAIAWLYNSDKAKQLPIDARTKMLESLNSVQSNIHEFNYNQALSQIQSAETQFKTTGQFDPEFVQRAHNYINTGEVDQTISLKHARSLRSALGGFYIQADKDAAKRHVSLYGTGADIDAAGISRRAAASDGLAAILQMYNGQPDGYIAAIGVGVDKGRPELVAKAASGAVNLFSTRLGKSTAELEQDEGAGLANNVFNSLGSTYKQLNAQGKFDLAEQLLAGFSDADQREAVRIMWSDPGAVPALGTESSVIYESLYSGLKASTADSYNQTITPETLEDGLFGKFSNALSADFNFAQSEPMLAWQANDIQEMYNNHAKHYFQANRIHFKKDDSGEGVTRAMLREGFLLNTKTQVLAINPAQRMAMGGGVRASDDRVNAGLDSIAQDVISRMGDVEPHLFSLVKNKVDRENVHFKLTNNGIIVGVMDDKGRSIGDYMHYTYGDVYKLSTPSAGVSVAWVGGINTAGTNFKVPADTGTFGSNQLKQGILKHLFVQEGYHKNLKASDPSRPDVTTFGHGITPGAAKDVFKDDTKVQRFISLAKDPSSPEYQVMYDEFINGYFDNFKDVAVKAGLPDPTLGSIDNVREQLAHTEAYKAIADAMYHGGKYGGADAITSILRLARSDKNAAVAMLEKQQFYIQTGKDSGRKEFLVRAVRSIPNN